jgi:hypothetical protein
MVSQPGTTAIRHDLRTLGQKCAAGAEISLTRKISSFDSTVKVNHPGSLVEDTIEPKAVRRTACMSLEK